MAKAEASVISKQDFDELQKNVYDLLFDRYWKKAGCSGLNQ